MRSKLLIATSNPGKLRELRRMLAELPFELLGLTEVPNLPVVAETGSTFIENASLKATGYASQSKILTLADDSGLEVDSLGGAPGVLSARYLGEGASYETRNRRLLAELKSVRNRVARFVCAVAIAAANGRVLYVHEAACCGRIAESSRGTGGFGYDPIFIPDSYNLTFAELPTGVKDHISHRGHAMTAARDYLASLTSPQTAD